MAEGAGNRADVLGLFKSDFEFMRKVGIIRRIDLNLKLSES
jgi:hypothetical protein